MLETLYVHDIPVYADARLLVQSSLHWQDHKETLADWHLNTYASFRSHP